MLSVTCLSKAFFEHGPLTVRPGPSFMSVYGILISIDIKYATLASGDDYTMIRLAEQC